MKRLTRAEILERHRALRRAVLTMFQARAALEAFPIASGNGLAFLETIDGHERAIAELRALMIEQDDTRGE